ncbi:hypothetical protein AAIB33_09550 [Microbacterium sp. AZCO]|uniref:hypothetical protein n=1 Tax=Microbacterium sp. AZCO TaxID=3142976 RepID=UPI0031F3ABD2
MPGVEIHYGGETYHIANRDVDDVAAEVLTATRNGGGWLNAVDGGGPTRLLISAGVSVALNNLPAGGDS